MFNLIYRGYYKYGSYLKGNGMIFTVLLLLVSVYPATVNGQGPALFNRPGSSSTYKVSFSNLNYHGVANAPLTIPLKITPYPAPAGYFFSVLADVLERPPGARFKAHPGDRQLIVTGNKPGAYRVRIRVNLLGKSSCGGIDAREIESGEISIELD